MFKLMDRVSEGINPMLNDLEEHIISAGLADMVSSADVITQVGEMQIFSDRAANTKFNNSSKIL